MPASISTLRLGKNETGDEEYQVFFRPDGDERYGGYQITGTTARIAGIVNNLLDLGWGQSVDSFVQSPWYGAATDDIAYEKILSAIEGEKRDRTFWKTLADEGSKRFENSRTLDGARELEKNMAGLEFAIL
jgi:hypothetical protein